MSPLIKPQTEYLIQNSFQNDPQISHIKQYHNAIEAALAVFSSFFLLSMENKQYKHVFKSIFHMKHNN